MPRRLRELVTADVWEKASLDERDAIRALQYHVRWRVEQRRHEPLEDTGSGRDGIFLTVGWMQFLLRASGARCTGEKAAAEAIHALVRLGVIEDTGTTKKPHAKSARAAFFRKKPNPANGGGREAQPTLLCSYWWRVFRVPRVAECIPQAEARYGAYSRKPLPPPGLASLSAWLDRQGLISRYTPASKRSRPRPGSIQWVFRHSGPP